MSKETNMPVSDDDLTLLYYGEHEQPGLAAQVAADPDLSKRYKQLAAVLELAQGYQPPPRGDEYGSQVWQKISPRLAGKGGRDKAAWWSNLVQPRFSLAGVALLAVVAMVAFILGRQDGAGRAPPVSDPAQMIASAAMEIDTGRLLNSSVAGHLEQLNVAFTQFANSEVSRPGEAAHATDMLVANRLYRQAASARGEQQLADFLQELEPLLIELAYEAHIASPLSRQRMQNELNGSLLFRLRLMNTRYNPNQTSI